MTDAAAAKEARRTALILAAAQAIVGSAAPIALSIGGLYLLGSDKSLATAPVTGYNVGVALGALPAAAIIRWAGQRSGFMLGTVVTALGLIGLGGAFVQQFRFAAADNAPPEFKARAISFVLAGGIITAILGPQIVIFTHNLFDPIQFAGAFAAIPFVALVGALILFLLRSDLKATGEAEDTSDARPLSEIISRPRFVVGLTCGIGSFALMVFVMTGAPLAMVGCGFTADQATLGISWHVMAMFGPSFFTGKLITRFGVERIVALGLLLLIACALVALSGIALWQFWTALILLGLGWNFGFIGSTAIIAETYRPSEKAKVQGFHDLVLFSSTAFASLMAGAAYNSGGWDMLNWIVFPVVAICFLALGWLAFAPNGSVAESA